MMDSSLRADAKEFRPLSASANVFQLPPSSQSALELRNDAMNVVYMQPWICSIDVECVSTGLENTHRAVARVAMVDQEENCLFDRMVKPEVPIASYLTPLTGIKPGDLDNAPNLETVREELLQILPKNACVVGQGVKKDMEWLNLKRGEHYIQHVDIGDFFKVDLHNGKSKHFSLRHEVLHLQGFEGAGTDIQKQEHDPITDALYSVRIFNRFCNAHPYEIEMMKQLLLNAPPTLPFWKTTPIIDGVHLGPTYYYRNNRHLEGRQKPQQQTVTK